VTLTVVCGSGHVSKWNLITEPQHYITVDCDGEAIRHAWDWDYWVCKYEGCQHREYAGHTIDNEWIWVKGDDIEHKNFMLGLMILSSLLTIKVGLGL
jgi:hypothetical protein